VGLLEISNATFPSFSLSDTYELFAMGGVSSEAVDERVGAQ
jgi:hypothetical protein